MPWKPGYVREPPRRHRLEQWHHRLEQWHHRLERRHHHKRYCDITSLRAALFDLKNTRTALGHAIQNNVVLQLEVVAGTSPKNLSVSEIQKYAGFDVGAFWVPRISEMRGFATVNVYPFAPVSITPANGLKLKERVSLTFGMSLGDISGVDDGKTKISGQNAFIYGLGFRVNRYFRIAVGGALYRAGSNQRNDNQLRNDFMVGPSIDFTALPALRSIFSSARGNLK